MSKTLLIKFAILLACLISTTAAFADVKIKSRQTMSGQTSESTTYIKGKRQRTEQNTGGVQMVSVTQCDLKRSLQIMPASQTYMINLWEAAGVAPATTTTTKTQTKTEKGGVVTYIYTTKDTGERRQMFGYTARHLIITMESESSPDACQKNKTKMQFDGWYIDAAFALDCDYGFSANYRPQSDAGGCRDRFETKQIGSGKRGYPLVEKTIMFDDGGKETFSMLSEVIELSQATLDAALFDVPAGYREVKNSTELYASMSQSNDQTNNGATPTGASTSGISQTIANKAKTEPNTGAVGAKKPGTIRIGVAGFKTGAIGEGVNGAELAGAVQNTIGEFLKGTKIELVALEAKVASALEAEAKQKECDFVLHAQVAHKKGGGGFGMFSKIAPALGSVVPLAGMGSTAGAVAGQVASTAIYTAANASGSIKAKDELTLDIKLHNGAAVALTKQFKTKAKTAGEDIISPLAEQAAAAILQAVS